MSSLDYLNLCRLCLVKERVSMPIFEGEGDVRQIFLKIAACLPVKVNKEDKLPKKICDDCVYKVELFYQFWNTTVNSEKQLLQWLGEAGLENKQENYGNVLNPNVVKQDQSGGNELNGSMMQQVNSQQNNINMGMIDNISLSMPIMMPTTSQQQQITSVPMDTSGSSVQAVQEIPGTSAQTAHEQITRNQTSAAMQQQQEREEESSEEDENSDDECDAEEALTVKEEGEEDPNSSRAIEPTTFVNVSLACDEAGPSGLQQQKISELPNMPIPPSTDADTKSGCTINNDPLDVQPPRVTASRQPNATSATKEEKDNSSALPTASSESDRLQLKRSKSLQSLGSSFLTVKLGEDYFRIPKSLSVFMMKEPKPKDSDKKEGNPEKAGTKEMPKDNDIKKVKPRRTEAKGKTEDDNDTKRVKPKKAGTRKKSEESEMKRVKPINEEIKAMLEENKTTKEKPQVQEKPEINHMQTRSKRKRVKEETDSLTATVFEDLDLEDMPLDFRKKYEEMKRSKLKSGRLSESKSKLHSCEICNVTFDHKSRLTSHMLKHSNSRPHTCDICSKGFKTGAYLLKHMETHSEPAQLHACTLCDFRARTKPYLKIHYIRKHTQDYKYSCEQCGKMFKVQSDYRTHVKDHDTEFCVCDICGSSYPSKSSLYFHKHYKHKTKVKDFECTTCKKKFKSQKNLDSHAELHKMKYVCEQCGMEFKFKYGLTKHMRTHSGEKSHLCAVCGKTFGCLSSQKIHLLTHVGERPYVCDICGQAFTQRSPMMLHRRKHPGAHPPPPPIKITNLLHGVQDKIVVNKSSQ